MRYLLILMTLLAISTITLAQETPTEKAIKNAAMSIHKIFRDLERTTFHDPYDIEIDLKTGNMSMDNGKVRWEFNVADLDPKTIHIGETTNGNFEIDCLGKRECATWYPYQTGGPLSYQSRISCSIYKRVGGEKFSGNYARDFSALKELSDSLTALINYFQQLQRQ